MEVENWVNARVYLVSNGTQSHFRLAIQSLYYRLAEHEWQQSNYYLGPEMPILTPTILCDLWIIVVFNYKFD